MNTLAKRGEYEVMNSISQALQIAEYTYEVKSAAVNHYVLILDLCFVHYDY